MPERSFHIWPDVDDGAQVKYLATWIMPDNIDRTLPNLEVVFSVGAGID